MTAQKKKFNPVKVEPNFFIGSKNRLAFPMAKLVYGGTLFVEPQDYDEYSKYHSNRFTIVRLPENDRGFAYLLNEMLRYAKAGGIKQFIFSDDDILGFKYRKNEIPSLNYHILSMTKILEENNFSQLMMSFSGHNWFYEGDIKENIGAWCFIMNKTEDLLKVGGYDEDLKIFNDWDMSANLIKNGFKTACYYRAYFEHKMNSHKGGAEEIYKKQKTLDEAIDYLQEKYGKENTKVVTKNGLRQIRFNWKKLCTTQGNIQE